MELLQSVLAPDELVFLDTHNIPLDKVLDFATPDVIHLIDVRCLALGTSIEDAAPIWSCLAVTSSQHLYGPDGFRKAIEAQLGRTVGPRRIGIPRRESPVLTEG